MQGPLKVVGQVRLQDSAWLAQLAKQASAAASATRKLPLPEIGPAVAAPIKMSNAIVRYRDFISNLLTSMPANAPGIHRSLMLAFDERWPHRFRPCLS